MRISVTAVDDKPVISNFGPAITYAGGKIAIASSTVAVSDIDSPNFAGGRLVVKMSAGGKPEDTFLIRAALGISTDIHGNVLYKGTAFGKVSGGSGTSLIVTFNAASDTTKIGLLIRNILYRDTAAVRTKTARTISLQISDGDGGSSLPAHKTLNFA
jgi:hypothetical protein